ncbi:MAG TPA: hypothetical protein DEH78_24175 [Solibacterales bacterium]|nr:hypothetical protein [Bryobacterales bacterium]
MTSFALHCAVAAVLFNMEPATFRPSPDRLRFVVRPLPAREPLIWYTPKKLPTIEPTQKFGEGPVARGEQKSDGEVVIARSPDARSKSQLIFQPESPKLLDKEVPSPNLLGAQPKAAPRKFEPPPEAPKPAAPSAAPALAAPEIKVSQAPRPEDLSQLAAVRIKAQPRAFEPPKPKLTLPEGAVLDGPPPEISGSGKATAAGGTSLLAAGPAVRAPKPAPKPFTPPTGSGNASGNGSGPGGTGQGVGLLPDAGIDVSRGTGSVPQAVVVGLNPTASGPPPPGSLPGSFSRAPNTGPAASGDLTGRADARIPDLMVRGGGSGAPVPPPPVGRSTSRQEIVFEIPPNQYGNTFSAPLRPNAGTVPPTIERLFPGRSVYALVIPPPKMNLYTDDWVIWFAEKAPQAGSQNPTLRPPLPARKRGGVVPDSVLEATDERVRFRVSISVTGQPENATLARPPRIADAQAALADLMSWEFHPSTRNGEPVEVDAVIEVAVRLPRLTSKP